MFNDIENQTNDADELKIITKLKSLTYMTIVLAVLRIISLDIMLLISDLLSALMIYFYAQSRNKCMAIFCGINGAVGLIYATIKFFSSWTVAKNNWFSLYYTLILLIAIYSLVIYSMMIYYAYVGYKRYEMFSTGLPQQQSSNYGSVISEQKSNFVAFSGKGTTLGS